MKGVREAVVGAPAVVMQEAVVVFAQKRGGLREAASGLDGKDGHVFGDRDPQPVRLRRHAPARLIEPGQQTRARGLHEPVIRRCGVLAQSQHRAADSAATGLQPIAMVQHLGDVRVGEAQLLGQLCGQRDRLRPQLDVRRAEGVGRLQRMPALHVPAAVPAVADLHIEPAHDGAPHDVFLKLWPGVGGHDPAPAAITRRRQRHLDRLVDSVGFASLGARSVLRPGLAARRLGIRLRGISRERRRLALALPQRLLQCPAQSLVLRPQGSVLAFERFESVAEILNVGRCHSPHGTRTGGICPAPIQTGPIS